MAPPSSESKLKRVLGVRQKKKVLRESKLGTLFSKILKAPLMILLRKKIFKYSLPQKCTSDSHMDARGSVYVHIHTDAYAYTQRTRIYVCLRAQNKLTAACFRWRPNTVFESSFYFSSKKFANAYKVVCETVSLSVLCSAPLSFWELVRDVTWGFLGQMVPAGTSSSLCQEVPE